jgi:hypothetical protein
MHHDNYSESGRKLSDMETILQGMSFAEPVEEEKMSKEKHKKEAKKGKRWQDSDGDGKWYEKGDDVAEGVRDDKTAERKARLEKKRGMKLDDHPEYKKEEVEVEEGYKSLPKEKMARQANNAYGKEQRAVKSGDEEETNKQMQRRIAIKDPSGRKAELKNKSMKEGLSFKEFVQKTQVEEGMETARNNVGASSCWKGYKADGTKKKNGKEVPNCVPEEYHLEMATEMIEEGYTEEDVRLAIEWREEGFDVIFEQDGFYAEEGEELDEQQDARNNPEKGSDDYKKKYGKVRGEKTPMPPRGDKRREDFEKFYAKQMGR